jgi:hypothetical protein
MESKGPQDLLKLPSLLPIGSTHAVSIPNPDAVFLQCGESAMTRLTRLWCRKSFGITWHVASLDHSHGSSTYSMTSLTGILGPTVGT